MGDKKKMNDQYFKIGENKCIYDGGEGGGNRISRVRLAIIYIEVFLFKLFLIFS